MNVLCRSAQPALILTDTRNLGFLPRAMAEHMVMASAAAVASSSREALEMLILVRSATMVWKFSSDSSLRVHVCVC